MKLTSNDIPVELLQAALDTNATQVLCTRCSKPEFLLPLEDDVNPFDAEFIASFVCADCEW